MPCVPVNNEHRTKLRGIKSRKRVARKRQPSAASPTLPDTWHVISPEPEADAKSQDTDEKT